jgi:hypothetical protein
MSGTTATGTGHGLLQQLSCLELPAFVANGDS